MATITQPIRFAQTRRQRRRLAAALDGKSLLAGARRLRQGAASLEAAVRQRTRPACRRSRNRAQRRPACTGCRPDVPEPVRGKSFATVEAYHLGAPASASTWPAGTFWAGTAYRRLHQIKAGVDPDDVIRANHPVTPAR